MKRKFNKGDIAVITDTDNFNLTQDIEVGVGDTFDQWGGTFKVTGISSIFVYVEQI